MCFYSCVNTEFIRAEVKLRGDSRVTLLVSVCLCLFLFACIVCRPSVDNEPVSLSQQ